MTLNLAQHVQGYVDCGQKSSERRCHVRVERWSGKTEHKQGSVFSQIHTLVEEREKNHFLHQDVRFDYIQDTSSQKNKKGMEQPPGPKGFGSNLE